MVTSVKKPKGKAQKSAIRFPFGLRDSTAIVATVTGMLYLLGNTYTTAYYGKLGVSESELDFSVAHILTQSFVPLIFPVFILVLFMVACVRLAKSQAPFRPFPPIPAHQVFFFVLAVWTMKLLTDYVDPVASERFLVYRLRDVLFFLFALAVLVVLWLLHRQAVKQGPALLRPATVSFAILIGTPILLILLGWVVLGEWEIVRYENLLLVAGMTYLAWQVRADFQARKKRRLAHEFKPWNPEGKARASVILLSFFSVILLLLSASMVGSSKATAVVEGCEPLNTISFLPAPVGLHQNRTYWLVLHDSGHYFVRDITPASGNITREQQRNGPNFVVSETPNMTAKMGWLPATRTC